MSELGQQYETQGYIGVVQSGREAQITVERELVLQREQEGHDGCERYEGCVGGTDKAQILSGKNVVSNFIDLIS